MRNATIKQLSEQKFKKTSIEVKIEELLKELQIKYTYSYILKRRQFDFYLPDSKIIIECHGDYWHASELYYGDDKKPMTDKQKLKKIDDIIKQKIVEDNGFKLLVFWETDINKNINTIKTIIENENENAKKNS